MSASKFDPDAVQLIRLDFNDKVSSTTTKKNTLNYFLLVFHTHNIILHCSINAFQLKYLHADCNIKI
jgi:hypothetical protein